MFPEATATAEDNGAASVLLTLDMREDMRAYDDWSFSSSSEKGLNDVRLAMSSALVLLRDLVDGPLPVCGRLAACRDSIRLED